MKQSRVFPRCNSLQSVTTVITPGLCKQLPWYGSGGVHKMSQVILKAQSLHPGERGSCMYEPEESYKDCGHRLLSPLRLAFDISHLRGLKLGEPGLKPLGQERSHIAWSWEALLARWRSLHTQRGNRSVCVQLEQKLWLRRGQRGAGSPWVMGGKPASSEDWQKPGRTLGPPKRLPLSLDFPGAQSDHGLGQRSIPGCVAAFAAAAVCSDPAPGSSGRFT